MSRGWSPETEKAIRQALDALSETDPKDVEELMDEIERLRAELAALKEAQRWIPVSEGLPEVGVHVEIVLGVPARNVSHGFYEGIDGWFDTWARGHYPVTHWRPLPQPPESEAE
jgi:hypothetical protein